MSLTASVLTEITTINVIPTVYVTRLSANLYIQQIALHNPAVTAITVKIYKVLATSGAIDLASISNIWYTESILPNSTSFISLDKPGIILANVNDTLQLSADISSTVTLQIYGFTEVI